MSTGEIIVAVIAAIFLFPFVAIIGRMWWNCIKWIFSKGW